jgi:predicted GH43/DUF377 family glycosyl hydrolase
MLKLPVVLIIISLSITLSVIPAAHADSGQWVKYAGNPILSPTPRTWDADYVTSPRVLYDGKIFRMWYQGGFSGNTRIGYATSIDGISWVKSKNPVLSPGAPGQWDSSLVGLGSVLWNGTIFLMWYSGSNPTTYDSGAVGLAMSTNGTNWVKYSGNPILTPSPTGDDSSYVAGPYAIELSGTYYMWYTGRNVTSQTPGPFNKIMLATSNDGVNWSKRSNPVLTPAANSSAWDASGVYAPSVVFDGKNFGLWYSGLNQSLLTPMIGFASSPDGATWTRSSNNPILLPGPPGSWDAAGVEQSSPVQFGGSYLLYYAGGGKIGLALGPHGFAIAEFPAPEFGLLVGVVACATIILLQQRRQQRA